MTLWYFWTVQIPIVIQSILRLHSTEQTFPGTKKMSIEKDSTQISLKRNFEDFANTLGVAKVFFKLSLFFFLFGARTELFSKFRTSSSASCGLFAVFLWRNKVSRDFYTKFWQNEINFYHSCLFEQEVNLLRCELKVLIVILLWQQYQCSATTFVKR